MFNHNLIYTVCKWRNHDFQTISIKVILFFFPEINSWLGMENYAKHLLTLPQNKIWLNLLEIMLQKTSSFGNHHDNEDIIFVFSLNSWMIFAFNSLEVIIFPVSSIFKLKCHLNPDVLVPNRKVLKVLLEFQGFQSNMFDVLSLV